MPKFVDLNGDAKTVRRTRSQVTNVSDMDAADPKKLAEILRRLSARVSELEARISDFDYQDHEVNMTNGAAVDPIYHGYGKPIRWSVVDWTGKIGSSDPTAAPILVRNSAKTSVDELHLTAYASGKAIVRIWPTDIDGAQ